MVAAVTIVFAGTTLRFHLIADRRSSLPAPWLCATHISRAS
jgi:hypothetical protein